MTVEVVSAADVPADAILTVLERSFERPLGMDWYRWKHESGPWGASRGWVATRDGEPAGVRLFTPWRYAIDGEVVDGSRALDGGVVPSARRQGIFGLLVRAEMDRIAGGPRTLIVSTAVPASQAAYEKLGWTTLGTVAHALRPAMPAPPRRIVPIPPEELLTDRGEEVLVRSSVARVTTVWTGKALAWRTHAASGHSYRVVRLPRVQEPHGLAYRIIRRPPLRTLVVVLAWGEPDVQRAVVRAVAGRVGATNVLEPIGTGAHVATKGPAVVRGGSTIVTLAEGLMADSPAWGLDGWSLSLADLEGVL